MTFSLSKISLPFQCCGFRVPFKTITIYPYSMCFLLAHSFSRLFQTINEFKTCYIFPGHTNSIQAHNSDFRMFASIIFKENNELMRRTRKFETFDTKFQHFLLSSFLSLAFYFAPYSRFPLALPTPLRHMNSFLPQIDVQWLTFNGNFSHLNRKRNRKKCVCV